MPKNIEYSRRSDRHKKSSKKRPSMSRWILVPLLLIILLLVTAGSYFGVKHYVEQKEKEEHFAVQEQKILKEIQEQQDQSELQTEKEVTKHSKQTAIVYIPKKGQVPNDLSKEKLEELLQKEQKKTKPSKAGIFVAHINEKKATEKLKNQSLSVDSYLWNDQKEVFEKQEELSGESLYTLVETGEKVTGKTLIESEENLLGIQQVIQQKILDQAKEPDKIIDAVLNLPRISFKDEIDYSPEKVHIHLPDNKTGVNDIDLDFNEIQPFIKTDLVDPKFLENKQPPNEKDGKQIALTFDDGPNAETTPKLLEILKEKDVNATFFMLGKNAQEAPDVVKKVHEQGHEIASHSYSHPQLNALSEKEVREEVHKADKAIFEASGILPRSLRPPYGAIDKKSAEIVGKPIIQWNIDSLDWQSKNAQSVIATVNQAAQDGGIILMHDIHPSTVEAVGTVIEELKNQGYEIVTVSQMLGNQEKPLTQYFGQDDHRKV